MNFADTLNNNVIVTIFFFILLITKYILIKIIVSMIYTGNTPVASSQALPASYLTFSTPVYSIP